MRKRDKLGIAIIGCGSIAYANAEAIQKSASAELVYAVDVNPPSAEKLGKRFDVPFTTRLEEALESKRVAAVFISTPHYLHAPLAEAAAAAGKHVIVEKPMGTTLEDSRRIVRACREAGVKLSVCYCMRYWKKVKMAKEFVEQGGLGKIIGTEMVMLRDRTEDYLKRNTWQEVNPNWHGVKAKSGGGIFIDNFSHNLDYFRYLTGMEIKWVFSRGSTVFIPADVEDSLLALCGYENGAFGSFIAGSSVRGSGTEENRKKINSLQRIWGEYGQIILEPGLALFSLKRVGKYEPNRWNYPGKKWRASRGAGVKERIEFVDMFARSVLEDTPLEITGEDGLKVMMIIDAVYRSVENGRRVDILP